MITSQLQMYSPRLRKNQIFAPFTGKLAVFCHWRAAFLRFLRYIRPHAAAVTEHEKTGIAQRATSEKASLAPQAWPSFAQPRRRRRAGRCKPPDRFRSCRKGNRRLLGLVASTSLDVGDSSEWRCRGDSSNLLPLPGRGIEPRSVSTSLCSA
jgi:hypothetical protein